MAKRQVVVCDVCERIDRPTKTYRITRDGTRYDIELCTEHSRPLETVLSKASSARPVRKATRFEEAITTMEDLEQRKRELAGDEKNTPAAS